MDIISSLYQFSSFALIGLIWTIQLVHYPSFHFVEEGKFLDFESFHKKAITIIVMPLMILELICALALLYLNYSNFYLINLIIICFIWLSTMLISVPIHSNLSQKKDKSEIDKLIITNWIRTFLWSAKGLLLIFFDKF